MSAHILYREFPEWLILIKQMVAEDNKNLKLF